MRFDLRTSRVLMVLLASWAGAAIAGELDTAPVPVTFGDSHLTVPAGWTHREQQANAGRFLLIAPPDATAGKLAVLLPPGRDLPDTDFPQLFDTILKQGLAANEHLVKYSEAVSRKASGYDMLTRSMVVADDAGHSSYRVCFGANPNRRLEMMILSADSPDLFKRYEAEIGVLLNSWSFDHAPAQASTTARLAGSVTEAPPQPAGAARTLSRVPEGESVLLCRDPARLDFAMDAARDGRSYDASLALRHDAFFRVNGPATLEITQTERQSRWPKALVTVVDGGAAGHSGWVVLSELKDVKGPAK